eukprot:COSAG01_NODE_48066_length_384_cov_1.003509_1_plen_80_part_01
MIDDNNVAWSFVTLILIVLSPNSFLECRGWLPRPVAGSGWPTGARRGRRPRPAARVGLRSVGIVLYMALHVVQYTRGHYH